MEDDYQALVPTMAWLDQQRAIARVPDGPGAVVLPRLLGQLLSSCAGFRSLSEHVVRFAELRQIAPEHRPGLLAALQGAARAGFMISRGDLLRRTATSGAVAASTEISSIAIITRDRPAGLERCLRSHLDNARSSGRAPSFSVVDSSTKAELREQNRAVLRAIDETSEGAVIYADADDKATYARRLAAESGLAEEVVRFALFDLEGVGHDTGANRNAVLLAHAGRAFLSADDDTVCDPRSVWPDDEDGEGLGLAATDPTTVRLYPDLVAAFASTQPAKTSALDGHERLLGKTVAACLEDHPPERVFLDGLPAPMMEALLDGRARVAATFSGLLGDGGAKQPIFHLFQGNRLSPEQAELENERQFGALIASRQILRAAPRLSITAGTFTMATTFALDARELCPPFFPVGRGEDLLFGNLFRRCWEDRFFGYLPWTIAHLPLDRREWREEQLWLTVSRRPLHSLLMLLFAEVSCTAAPSGRARLCLFGRQLQELGRQPWPDLERILRRQSWRQGERQLARLDSLIRQAPPRSAWGNRAREYRQACEKSLMETSNFQPPDFDHLARDDARRAFARLCARFGGVLESWSTLFEAAQALSKKGVTFFRPP